MKNPHADDEVFLHINVRGRPLGDHGLRPFPASQPRPPWPFAPPARLLGGAHRGAAGAHSRRKAHQGREAGHAGPPLGPRARLASVRQGFLATGRGPRVPGWPRRAAPRPRDAALTTVASRAQLFPKKGEETNSLKTFVGDMLALVGGKKPSCLGPVKGDVEYKSCLNTNSMISFCKAKSTGYQKPWDERACEGQFPIAQPPSRGGPAHPALPCTPAQCACATSSSAAARARPRPAPASWASASCSWAASARASAIRSRACGAAGRRARRRGE